MSTDKSETKREEYRKYLERGGVLDAIVKVMVALYEEPEKPNNALEFVRSNLVGSGPQSLDMEAMKGEITELKSRCEILQSENQDLVAHIQHLETASPSGKAGSLAE